MNATSANAAKRSVTMTMTRTEARLDSGRNRINRKEPGAAKPQPKQPTCPIHFTGGNRDNRGREKHLFAPLCFLRFLLLSSGVLGCTRENNTLRNGTAKSAEKK